MDLFGKCQKERVDNLDQANQEIDRLRKHTDKLQAELQGKNDIWPGQKDYNIILVSKAHFIHLKGAFDASNTHFDQVNVLVEVVG